MLCFFAGIAGQMPGALRLTYGAAASPPQATSGAPTKPAAASGDAGVTQAIQQDQSRPAPPQPPSPEKQRNDLLKANFEKMKHDAGELAELAKALQQELEKSNENILSLDIVEKAERIEKLAKRIKGTARGF
jgi:hypothetical protein